MKIFQSLILVSAVLAQGKGKGGKNYAYRSAFCLESQTFPDSPNQKEFPSPVLRPGETYNQVTIYQLGLKDVKKKKGKTKAETSPR